MPAARPKPGARPRKTRPPHGRKAQPLAVFACDTVVRLQAGLRRSLFTFIDPYTRFAVAVAAATPPSRWMRCAISCRKPPRYVLSDNGSEFLGHFQQRLDERFNRTLQEQCVDYHEDLLFDDLAAFNRQLADWLLAYNTVLPHHSLGRQSPVQCLLQHQREDQRWWTHTIHLRKAELSRKLTRHDMEGS